MALFKRGMAGELATRSAEEATEAGLPVLVLRFNEKVTEVRTSGSPLRAVQDGIAAVEASGHWRFESMTVEQDERTMGDRMAFYTIFRAT